MLTDLFKLPEIVEKYRKIIMLVILFRDYSLSDVVLTRILQRRRDSELEDHYQDVSVVRVFTDNFLTTVNIQ
jgi:hypothetical protein